MLILNKLKKKFYKLRDVVGNTIVYFVYYNIPINDKLVYIESQSGKTLGGNLLRICEELHKEEYKNLKIIVKATKESKKDILLLIKNYNLKNVKIITTTIEALVYLEHAKYIFYDAGVQSRYVKREGQIFVNTWHGTPFKVMGKSIFAERHSIGNLQRNFFMCDYLLFPNRYMQKIFIKDYMLENVWTGKSLLAGYPRNAVFYNDKRRGEIKNKLNFANKKIFAYLPTHRGNIFKLKNDEQVNRIKNFLNEIDKNLKDDEILLLKLHLYNNKHFDCSGYKHIVNFPVGYETYDVLNCVDCLITDYSSVFFDFANTRKKIILFAYDEEEYFLDRGVYFPFSKLPFPKVKSVESLLKEMRSSKNYEDEDFINTYCSFDNIKAAENICRHVIKNEKCCLEEDAPNNGKENVLIYAGNLAKNGITSSLYNLLNSIDLNKRNYFITYYRSSVNTPEKTLSIPNNISFLPIAADPYFTFLEKIMYIKLLRSKSKKYNLSAILKRMYDREIKKQFWNVKFQHVLQFDGYTKHAILMFSILNANRSIWVHSDMVFEIETKHNATYAILNYAYNIYNNVALVSEDIKESAYKIANEGKNLKIVHNFFDNTGIVKKSNDDIVLDKDTEVITNNINGINGVLNSGGQKFITIGRFSPEKGHIRLLNAFEHYWLENGNTQLIIIGGNGNEYEKTVKYAKSLKSWKNITIIKSISNPMPILKKCDLFILSSFYEGLGLVLLEANTLNVPCISTDIVGPRLFMQKNGGYLVENTEHGILDGMNAFKNGKVKVMNIDFENYNKQCLTEFEELFKN